jgi:glyoxylase-like metal-dependent hydrolase (beta-lactamase superfamily II)
MRPKEIAENFFFVQRGWLNANQFIFNGNRKVLIDTGYISDFEDTRRFVCDLGLDLREVDLIVSTHSHCDHIGGNKRIQDLSECKIAMHRIDKYFINVRDDWATWWKYYDQEAEFFRVDLSFEEGDTISLDELKLKVLHVPGHGSGMIALYSPEKRFLISSDALWEGDLGVLTVRVEGSIAPFLALDSLDRLSTLKMNRIYPGHGPPILEPKAAIQKCREKLEGFLRDPSRIGMDQLKKIFIYVLLMKKGFAAHGFLDYLMETYWFKETVDLFFEGRYERVFMDTIESLKQKGVVQMEGEKYVTTVKA